MTPSRGSTTTFLNGVFGTADHCFDEIRTIYFIERDATSDADSERQKRNEDQEESKNDDSDDRNEEILKEDLPERGRSVWRWLNVS